MINIEALMETLATTGATVTFTKSDGTERVMRCTRNFADIPVELYPQQESLPTVKSETTVRVFDLDINEWRSFRKDSVTKYLFLVGDIKSTRFA